MPTTIPSFSSRIAMAGAPPEDAAILLEPGREGLFAWSGANLADHVGIDSQQGVYVPPSCAPTGASGAWVRKYSGPVDIRWFGAVLDGVTNCDTAFQAWMSYLIRVSVVQHYHLSGGHPRGYIPAGKVKLTQGFVVSPYNAFGITIEGDGPETTEIQLWNDTATLFDVWQYSHFHLRELCLTHVAQNPDRTTWTCKMFSAQGDGGGQLLQLDRVDTVNFARIIDIYDVGPDAANCDTTRATGCRFFDFRTFFYARSNQALANKFMGCVFGSNNDTIFDIVGVGYTCLDTCNIVTRGSWFRLNEHSSRWGVAAEYLLINCKGEPERAKTQNIVGASGIQTYTLTSETPADYRSITVTIGGASQVGVSGTSPSSGQFGVSGTSLHLGTIVSTGASIQVLYKSRTKIIELAGSNKALINCAFRFINCGFSSTLPFDPSFYQLELTANIGLTWEGGEIDPTAQIITRNFTGPTTDARRGIIFREMARVPSPLKVTRSSSGSAPHPSITYYNCGGVTNICYGMNSNAATVFPMALLDAEQSNVMTGGGDLSGGVAVPTFLPRLNLTADADQYIDLPFYGCHQLIKDVYFIIRAKDSGTLTVSIYKDAARTSLLESLTASGTNSEPSILSATSSTIGQIVSEGLYFKFNGPVRTGYVVAKHAALG